MFLEQAPHYKLFLSDIGRVRLVVWFCSSDTLSLFVCPYFLPLLTVICIKKKKSLSNYWFFFLTLKIEIYPWIIFSHYLPVQRFTWHALLYNLYWPYLSTAQACCKNHRQMWGCSTCHFQIVSRWAVSKHLRIDYIGALHYYLVAWVFYVWCYFILGMKSTLWKYLRKVNVVP